MPVGDEVSAGQAWSVKSANGRERGRGEVGGTVMCHRSDPASLVPVRKGVTEEEESKNSTDVLVKRVCP